MRCTDARALRHALRSCRKIIYFRDKPGLRVAREDSAPTPDRETGVLLPLSSDARISSTWWTSRRRDEPTHADSRRPLRRTRAASRPGHRGADMRDTVAEMAERAQLISQEAGSKVSAAMKDVISAAAGLAGFAIESARDLVQYMVRRGQMTPGRGGQADPRGRRGARQAAGAERRGRPHPRSPPRKPRSRRRSGGASCRARRSHAAVSASAPSDHAASDATGCR